MGFAKIFLYLYTMAQLDLFGKIQEEIQEQQKTIAKKMESKVVQKGENSEKLYHTISEVATLYNVNASLLRFWETEFPQIKLRKTGRGDRLYSKENIELIGTIYYLTKEKKFTLEGDLPSLIDGSKLKMMSFTKEARDFLSTDEGRAGLKAAAMLVSGPVSRALANFFLLVTVKKPVIPTKIFSDYSKAMLWLNQFR